MNPLFKRHKALAVLAASALVLAGCSEDTPAGLSGEDVTLRLTLDYGLDASSSSRADNTDKNDGYEQPSGEFEQIHTLRVIIVRQLGVDASTGMPLEGSAAKDAVVEYNKLVMTSPETGMPLRDKLEFKVKDNESKIIYLIANEEALPNPLGQGKGTTTAFLDGLKRGTEIVNDDFDASKLFNNWVVSMPKGNIPNATSNMFDGARAIPLTEFFKVDVTRTSPGRTDAEPSLKEGETQSVHLFLTRAVAKVSFNVKVDDSYKASGSNITGIRFKGFNWTEYVFPHAAKYSPDKVVEDFPYNDDGTPKQSGRYITTFQPLRRTQPAGCVYDITGLNIPVQAGTDQVVGPFYFPESAFTGNEGTFNVQIMLDNSGSWISGTPTSVNYLMVNGYPAVARNTHLKYEITFGATGINWQAIEAPYNSVFLDPWFGL